MKLLFLVLLSSLTFAQTFKINGKELKLSELKQKFKVHTISIYNYDIKSHEKYHALQFNELMLYATGNSNWLDNFSIEVTTKDKYRPIIEMYKFKERKAYLAFERADQKNFTSISDYKENFVDLSPFYLIWDEDYKLNAAKRRNHWPYQVTGFTTLKHPPISLIPDQNVSKDILWGYKNFLKQCIACHQINEIGSDKAGELIKSTVLDRYSDKNLARYISNPRSINKNAKMPTFPEKIDIRKERIQNIVKYLRYMKKRNFQNFIDSKKNEKIKRSSSYQKFLKQLEDI